MYMKKIKNKLLILATTLTLSTPSYGLFGATPEFVLDINAIISNASQLQELQKQYETAKSSLEKSTQIFDVNTLLQETTGSLDDIIGFKDQFFEKIGGLSKNINGIFGDLLNGTFGKLEGGFGNIMANIFKSELEDFDDISGIFQSGGIIDNAILSRVNARATASKSLETSGEKQEYLKGLQQASVEASTTGETQAVQTQVAIAGVQAQQEANQLQASQSLHAQSALQDLEEIQKTKSASKVKNIIFNLTQ